MLRRFLSKLKACISPRKITILVMVAVPLFSISCGLLPGTSPTAEDYYNAGVSAYDNKHYSVAIDNFTKAIELDPQYSEAYNNRGITYFHLEKYDHRRLQQSH